MAAHPMPPAVVSLPFLASLLLIFLLHHVVDAAECEPVACGNFTIKYPFWLGAPGRPPPEPSCGHPAFELWCINGNTTATMSGSPIHVHSIDYGARSFVVVHSRVAADTNGVCLADFNVSSSLALSPFKISPSNRALGFLFNCNGTEPRGREYANATAGCSRPIVAYLGGSFVRDTPPAIPTGNCTYTYLPVLGSEAAVSTAADYTRLLKAGFLLDWAGAGIGIGDCPACVASGGQCRYRSATAALACLCPGGKLRGPACAGEFPRRHLPLLYCTTVLRITNQHVATRIAISAHARLIISLIFLPGSLHFRRMVAHCRRASQPVPSRPDLA
ncbi:hypothetical protein ACQJBY_020745 [Aegilops geniculata]